MIIVDCLSEVVSGPVSWLKISISHALGASPKPSLLASVEVLSNSWGVGSSQNHVTVELGCGPLGDVGGVASVVVRLRTKGAPNELVESVNVHELFVVNRPEGVGFNEALKELS